MGLLKGMLPGSIPFLLIAFMVGLVLLRQSRTHRWGRRWLWGLFVLYLGFSMPAVSRLVAAPLALGFAPVQTPEVIRNARAIIVLDGGTLRYEGHEGLFELPNQASVLRALEAARVYRLLGEPLVVVSGGDPAWRPGRAPEASAMRDALVRLGVPPQRIILDSDSQNTRAHALNLVRLLKEHGIVGFVLVTSPTHMRRSMMAFRAMGADPIPSPATSPFDNLHGWTAFWPSPVALLLTEEAMHDYVGLVYYRLQGWL